MDFNTASTALKDPKGGTFVGLDTETVVTLRGGKKNPQQGRVTKRVTGSRVMCFSNSNTNAYAAMVQRRLVQEGKDPAAFELGPRAWGERVPDSCFVVHRGSYYLEAIFLQAGSVQYCLDGVPVPASSIEGLPETREQTGQGGLENAVVIRTYALESIVALRANGQEWR